MAPVTAEQIPVVAPPTPRGTGDKPSLLHSIPRLPTKWMLLILIVATALPYLPSLRYGFVYDDAAQAVGTVAAQASRSPVEFFFTSVWDFRHAAMALNSRYYRPVFHTWLRLNAVVFGYNAAGWHLSSVCLHLGVTVLVFFLMRRHFEEPWIALAGALVFGVHPVHLESVAWVSGVTDPLATLGVLGSFLLWQRRSESRGPLLRVGSLVCFAGALLAKEIAIVLPAIIMVYVMAGGYREERIPGTAKNRVQEAVQEALPYVAVAIAYLLVRSVAIPPLHNPSLPWVTRKEAILTLPSVVLFYARHLLWAARLTVFPNVKLISGMGDSGFWLPLAILLLVSAAVAWWLWRVRESNRNVLAALAWLCLPLLPVLNLAAFFRDDFAHDRYLYLPSVGFAFLCAEAARRFLGVKPATARRWIGLAVTTALVAVLAFSAAAQSAAWQSNISLYTRASQLSPNPVPRVYLAAEYLDRGQPREAHEILQRVVQDAPDSWGANYYLGSTDYQMRDLPSAEHYLKRAIAIDPAEPDEYLKLGLTYLAGNRPADAETQVRAALARNPDGEGYHFALGVILMTVGKRNAGKDELREELERSSSNIPLRTQIENMLRSDTNGPTPGLETLAPKN